MSRSPPRVVLIAAVGRNLVIGTGDRLPWHLPADLRHFQAATMGKPVIFGRATLQAIGRALPGRACIMLTRNTDLHMPDVVVATDLAAALAQGRTIAARLGATEIMVAGGASIYAAALPIADELLLTQVDLAPSGDKFFPTFAPEEWRVLSQTPLSSSGGGETACTIVRYARRPAEQCRSAGACARLRTQSDLTSVGFVHASQRPSAIRRD